MRPYVGYLPPKRITAARVDGATPVIIRLGGEAQLAAGRCGADLSPRRATCARQLQHVSSSIVEPPDAALQGWLGGSVLSQPRVDAQAT